MMKEYDDYRILICSPHTDDGELTAGGTIAKLREMGAEVYYVAFSCCEDSVPKEYECHILRSECIRAMKILGIPESHLMFKNYSVRSFHNFRQKILDDLLDLQRIISPNLIITPSSYDVHQDHQVIHMESIRAFKKTASIIGMEHPWNNLSFKSDVAVPLTEAHVEKKLAALHEYHSQSSRKYFDETYIRALAQTRGLNINADYAETFECIRVIF